MPRRRRTLRKRRGGGGVVPAFPKDANGVPYKIYYANPISDFVGYSTILQLETAKFNAVTTKNPVLDKKRAIKIGDNFAFKFFYFSSGKWYVMLNMQVMKNWFWSKHDAKNMEIFEMKPDAMWFDPNVQNNISNKPDNNSVVLRFNSQFVKGETSDQLEIDPQELVKIPDPWKDPIVSYLQFETFGKEVLKEETNNIIYDSFFSWLGL
jgi:hypothetical protein